MNKQKFTKVLQNYHNIPDEDRERLHELAISYPYSQIIHTLVAKANHDAQTSIAAQTLNYAAMYASDRSVLKAIIRETPEHQKSSQKVYNEEVSAAPLQEQTPAAGKRKVTVDPAMLSEDSNSLRDEILVDLEALRKSKANYMEWLQEDTEKSNKTAPKASKTKSEGTEKKTAKKKATKTTESVAKSTEEETAPAPKKKGTGKKKGRTKKKTAGEKTISSKENDDDQKDIIETFISKEPSITAKPLQSSENQPDLSEASTAFNEDLVSENLANILVNQGKKEKAIDIYKKLIWKFPQKKAYFASRIEELQK